MKSLNSQTRRAMYKREEHQNCGERIETRADVPREQNATDIKSIYVSVAKENSKPLLEKHLDETKKTKSGKQIVNI